MTATDLKAAILETLRDAGILSAQPITATAQPTALTVAEKRRENLKKAREAKAKRAAERAAEKSGNGSAVQPAQPVTTVNAQIERLTDPVLRSLYALTVTLSQELQHADDPRYATANVRLWRVKRHARDIPELAALPHTEIEAAMDKLAAMGKLTRTTTYKGEPRYCPDVFADYNRPSAIPRKAGRDAHRSEIARRVAAMAGRL